MKIPKYFIAIIIIIILASCSLFYFINQNHKTTTENSLAVNQSRKTLKNIDAAFYTISELENSTQKYVISGDPIIGKNAENQLLTMRDYARALKKQKIRNRAENLDTLECAKIIKIQKMTGISFNGVLSFKTNKDAKLRHFRAEILETLDSTLKCQIFSLFRNLASSFIVFKKFWLSKCSL